MKKSLLLFPLLMCSSVATMASNDLSYTWIELDYINLDIDGYDNDRNLVEDLNDGNGWGVQGSLALSEYWFAFSNYSTTKADVSFIDEFDQLYISDTDINRFDLGLGYKLPMSTHSDLIFKAAYVDIDLGNFDFGATGNESFGDLGDDGSDGFFADVSVRTQINASMEGAIGLRYTDIEKVDNLGLNGNLLFELSSNMGINLGVDVGDELTTWVLGARFSF